MNPLVPLLPLVPPVVALAEAHTQSVVAASACDAFDVPSGVLKWLTDTHQTYFRNLNIPAVRDAWVLWWWNNREGDIASMRNDAAAMHEALIEAFTELG